jgi:hypothetical protein
MPANAGIQYAATSFFTEPSAFTGSSAFADDDGVFAIGALHNALN